MKSTKSNHPDVLVRTIGKRSCLTLILLLCASSAYSDTRIFKCVDGNGIVNFTDFNKTGEWRCEERVPPATGNDKKTFNCTNKKGIYRVSDFDETGAWKCKGLDLPSAMPAQAKAKSKILLSIGMSKDEVIKHWGNPIYKPRRTQTRDGITEKLTYPNGVLTFVNGTLEIIQN